MNLNIDIKKAAASIQSFIKGHGGKAQRSEVLELLAKVSGFDCYRAMLAASEAPAMAQTVSASIPSGKPVDGRPLESPENVVFRAETVDWELAALSDTERQEYPENRRASYDFIVEQYGAQFRVLLKPEGVGLDNFDGRNVLDILVEINEGVPCVHLTNDPNDAMLLSVFATSEGLVARPDDGECVRATMDLPQGLRDLVAAVCDERELGMTQVCLYDTKEKYREEPSSVPEQFPCATADVINPKSSRFLGLKAQAQLEQLLSGRNELTLSVRLIDANGVESMVGQEDCPFPGASSFDAGILANEGRANLVEYTNLVASMMAYFIAGNIDIYDVVTVIRKIACFNKYDALETLRRTHKLISATSQASEAYTKVLNYLLVVE